MNHDGKRLEALVAFVEGNLLPEGFVVTTNDRVYNDEGVQIAEFDIQASGRVGSTDFVWLIECRDRPASGPAPGSWIEQLVGRRARFRFDKVTAVSTTGFAAGVAEFARSQGVELREVKALTPEAFADWMPLKFITTHIRHSTLHHASFLLDEATPKELYVALGKRLEKIDGKEAFLRSSTTGELTSPAFAFAGAAGSHERWYEELKPNGDAKSVRIHANYAPEDHFTIETWVGPVPIATILFEGELRLLERQIPVAYVGEYRSATTGEPISQHVSFEPLSAMGMRFATEFHRLAATGETHVVLRKVRGDAD
jgi:hypothetical protein